MPSYSKAPRGLFVQVKVGRVFTAIAISPSEGSRQLLTRYAFRAGRNLPDKELRLNRYSTISHLIVLLHVAMQIALYLVRSVHTNVL